MKDKNQKSERIPSAIARRKIKYLEIKLTKKVRKLYTKNTQHRRKKLKKTEINWSKYHVHGLKESTSSKCPYYPK